MKDIISLPLETPGPGIDSKYRLAVLAAQRAVQISKAGRFQSAQGYRKATTQAIAELQAGSIPFALEDEAITARRHDEDLYKSLLAEARSSYVDEEGNPVFQHRHGQGTHTPAS
ncbi:MAG: DNA-directed RNA polymerase subunit omega [Nitrospirota bacterium]|nr:DNA-directed RNA polymerase subunit omega [Nitrospirota bacterium]